MADNLGFLGHDDDAARLVVAAVAEGRGAALMETLLSALDPPQEKPPRESRIPDLDRTCLWVGERG